MCNIRFRRSSHVFTAWKQKNDILYTLSRRLSHCLAKKRSPFLWRNRSSTSAARSYPKQSFQLQKALKNGLFEFDGLRFFRDFQCLQISWFTVGIPIETNHAIMSSYPSILIYYMDSHSNKLNNDLARLHTQTDRSSRLLGVGSSASDMFMSWVSTCLRCIFR